MKRGTNRNEQLPCFWVFDKLKERFKSETQNNAD
jgi:hypothetical protein